MSGAIRHDQTAQLCVLLCETIALPGLENADEAEGELVCHWYITLPNGGADHLNSEPFSVPPLPRRTLELNWCAFLVADANTDVDLRLTVADMHGNHLGVWFGNITQLATSDQFEVKELTLENTEGTLARVTLHAATQIRWMHASTADRQRGTAEFIVASEDAQAGHIWGYLFPDRAPLGRPALLPALQSGSNEFEDDLREAVVSDAKHRSNDTKNETEKDTREAAGTDKFQRSAAEHAESKRTAAETEKSQRRVAEAEEVHRAAQAEGATRRAAGADQAKRRAAEEEETARRKAASRKAATVAAASSGDGESRGAVEGQDQTNDSWDPIASYTVHRSPSSACLRRVSSEIHGLMSESLPGIYVSPDSRIVTMVHALISGPVETPYAGGLFHFVIDMPDLYPQIPPRVRLLTTGAGSVRFNPQFYTNGKVCLSILNTWAGPSWQPTFTLRTLLLQLHALMNETPALNEPGMMIMADPEEYNAFLRHEVLRVAVLGVAEEALQVLADEGMSYGRPRSIEATPPVPFPPSPLVRLPCAFAEDALQHLRMMAPQLEARCSEAATTTPDGTVLPGLPKPVRTEYFGMLMALRRLRIILDRPVVVQSLQSEFDDIDAACISIGSSGNDGADAGGAALPDARHCASDGNENALECRICTGGPEDGELITPCGCSGTMAHVHRKCALEQISHNGSPICPICRKRYTDPALRAMGTLGRCRRVWGDAVRCLQFCAVIFACMRFNSAIGMWLRAVPVAPHDLHKWTLQPPASSTNTTQYVLHGKHIVPAGEVRERWRSPIVEGVLIHAQTPWTFRTVAVPVSIRSLALNFGSKSLRGGQCDSLLQSAGSPPPQRPANLGTLLTRRSRYVSLGRQRLRRHWLRNNIHQSWPLRDSLGFAIDRLRAFFLASLESTPSVTLRLMPPCVAKVVVITVLYAWLAIGRRSLLWLVMCCHIGFRFAPPLAVPIAAFGAPFVAHQVRRWLAQRGMLRRRNATEADALIILLLIWGSFCQGHSTTGGIMPGPVARMIRTISSSPFHLTMSWVFFALAALYAVGTVAQAPELRPGVRGKLVAALHGLLWCFLLAMLCIVGVVPTVGPWSRLPLAPLLGARA